MASMFSVFPAKLQIIYRRNIKDDHETMFGWKFLRTNPITGNKILGYNIYESSNGDGPFTLFISNIPNKPSNLDQFKNKVITRVLDHEVPIPLGKDHYFKLTYIEENVGESILDDSEPVLVHPPQINPFDLGEAIDTYVFNWCWDEVNHRWVKCRYVSGSEDVSTIINTISKNITFNQEIIGLEVANNSSTATIYLNINGGIATTTSGIPIYPQMYYTAGRLISAPQGISIISTENNTDVRIVGHY